MVYNKEFASFMCEVLSKARTWFDCTVSMASKSETSSLLYTVCSKLFVEIIPRIKLGNLKAIESVGTELGKFFGASLEESKKFLLRFVKEKGSRMFDLMVKCPEVAVRNYMAKALLAAFLRIFPADQEDFSSGKGLSRDFMDMCVGFIGYDLATQWTKFRQFFELLRDIVKLGGEKLVQYCCFEKELISILLDFFLGVQSPLYNNRSSKHCYEMGNQAQEPDFSPLIELISYLVITCKSPLPENSAKCLRSDEILAKHIKCSGTVPQISPLILHLCTNDKHYTKRLCRQLLRALNDHDLHKASLYLPLVGELIMAPFANPAQTLRIEWLLGFPQPLFRNGFGLSSVVDIADEVNGYVSSVARDKEDPLLQLLWKHRRRSESFSLQGIRMLFRAISKSELVLEYVQQMPSPGYTYESFIDWMCDYVNGQKPGKGGEQKEKEQVVAEAQGLAKDYCEKRGVMESSSPSLLYMIGKSVSSKALKEYSNKGVRLVFTEISAEIYPSSPDGEHNLALDSDYLVKYAPIPYSSLL